MIDFHTYEELHPQNHYSLTMKGHDKATVSPFNAAEPSATELYVFPPRIPGFDLRLKKWCKSSVIRRNAMWPYIDIINSGS